MNENPKILPQPGTPNLRGTPGSTPSTFEGYNITPNSGSLAKAAAESQSNMPVTDLDVRTIKVIEDKSKDMGFFRAFWNYISNSSTKSMDQARLNLAAQDYLKANPKEIDGILREFTTNPSSQDPKIVHAFAAALKKIDLGKLNDLLFLQSAFALHSLAQKFPANQITSELIAFCNNFPKQARALAERQDLGLTSFQGTDCTNGLTLMYDDSSYKPEILNFINSGLFEGEDRDTQIKSFIKNQFVKGNFFFKDGIDRCEIPHIILPGEIEILSNVGGNDSEYCKKEGKTYDRAEYLKYVLDEFKKAYGSMDEAVKAFKVFVQNFTGSLNTFAKIREQIYIKMREKIGRNDALAIVGLTDYTLQSHQFQPMMWMDKDFNIRLNITACIFGRGTQEFNERHKALPNFRFHKDTIFGIAISSHIPAAISDTMDQREQHGRQTTTFGVIESFGGGSSN
jgi:hypothetical protein